MKILKIIQNIFNSKQVKTVKNIISACPINYDRNNVTAKEYREYIHWLAQNNINRTVYEPDRFITETEREVLAKRKSELDEYKNFIRNLAQNNINRTFYC